MQRTLYFTCIIASNVIIFQHRGREKNLLNITGNLEILAVTWSLMRTIIV